MLRHIIVLTALSVGSLQGVAQAVSFSGGNESGGSLKLEQAHRG